MRSARCIAVMAILFLSSCGGPVSSRAVREQIATLGGAGLATDDVRVERVIAQSGKRAIAEATVQLAFEFAQNADGVWEITAVRVGEDEWIGMDTFLAALRARQIDETTSNLRMLAAGVEAFERENGTLPEVTEALPLPDLLHPRFVPNLVREDSWGSKFLYEPSGDTVRLRSAGPDRQAGTADDIEVRTEPSR